MLFLSLSPAGFSHLWHPPSLIRSISMSINKVVVLFVVGEGLHYPEIVSSSSSNRFVVVTVLVVLVVVVVISMAVGVTRSLSTHVLWGRCKPGGRGASRSRLVDR